MPNEDRDAKRLCAVCISAFSTASEWKPDFHFVSVILDSKPMNSNFIPVPGSEPVTCVMDEKAVESLARQQLLGIEEPTEEVESMDEKEDLEEMETPEESEVFHSLFLISTDLKVLL